jgi:hypothetical protein
MSIWTDDFLDPRTYWSKIAQHDDDPPAKNNRIFCMILTKPDNFKTRALVTLYVWVSKCSDYRYISVTPEHLVRPDNKTFVDNSEFKLLHPNGLITENYYDLTRKIFYAFRDIYEEVQDKYDWYLKADGKKYYLKCIVVETKSSNQKINMFFKMTRSFTLTIY